MKTTIIIDGPSVLGAWKNIINRNRLAARPIQWHDLPDWAISQFGDTRIEMILPDWLTPTKGQCDFRKYLSNSAICVIDASREVARSIFQTNGLPADDAAVISRMRLHAQEGCRIVVMGQDHIHALAGLALTKHTEVLAAGFPEEMAREYRGFREVFDMEFNMGLVPPTGRFGLEAA